MLTTFTKYKSFLFILLLCFFNLLAFIVCPTTIYAMGPEEVIDYYDSVEYIGKDPYGYYNNPAHNKIIIYPDVKPKSHTYVNDPILEKN